MVSSALYNVLKCLYVCVTTTGVHHLKYCLLAMIERNVEDTGM